MNEREKRNKQQSKGFGEPVQLELPEIFVDRPEFHEALTDDTGCADIISKSDLAMMRGRRKRHDRQKRNER